MLPANRATAIEALVLGDSIGLGLATTIGLKSIARVSLSLRRSDVGAQLKQIPAEAVGLMSIGLNLVNSRNGCRQFPIHAILPMTRS